MFKEKLRETLQGSIKVKETCPVCHQAVNLRKGTMTAWLFKDARCHCGTISHSALEPAANGAASVSEDEALVDLGDAYEVIAKVGQGGMGAVYKVKDIALGKTFAVKVLKAEHAKDKAAVKRFQQEVTAAKNLTHPNLAAVYGAGVAPDGRPYFIMDYLDGLSLADVLQKEVYLDIPAALDMFIDVADALEHAHHKGVVHRDLKPSNIILTKSENGQNLARIVDFGIASVMPADGATATRLTQTGEIFGSPAYMSPEQCKGEKLDVRSDIYSLGCVMYETLTGKAPFADDNAVKTILKHLTEAPKGLRKEFPNLDIPAGLDSVVEHCLEKDADERYQSMAQLRQDLELIRGGKSPTRCSPSPKRKAQQVAKIRRWGLLGMGAMAALIALPIVAIVGYANFLQLTVPSWEMDRRAAMGQMSLGGNNASQARVLFQKALDEAKAGHASEKDLEVIYFGLGRADYQLQRYARARPNLAQALALNRKHSVDLTRVGTLEMLSDCDLQAGNLELARSEAEEAITTVRPLNGTNSQQTANALGFLCQAYRRSGQLKAAEKANQEQLDLDLKLHPDKQYDQIAQAYSTRADIMSDRRDSKQAIEAAKTALALYKDQEGTDGSNTQHVARWLIKYLIAHNRSEEGKQVARQCKIDNSDQKKSKDANADG